MSSDKISPNTTLTDSKETPRKDDSPESRDGGQSGGTNKTGQLKTVGGKGFTVGQTGTTQKTGELKTVGGEGFPDA